MLSNGVDIRIIQFMPGHTSIQQTQRYLTVTDEDLRTIVDRAFEKGEQVLIYFTRWNPYTASFVNAVSRRRFTK